MNKSELINKYGIDWYNNQLLRKKQRYANDIEFKERKKSDRKKRYASNLNYRECHKKYGKFYNYRRYALNGKIELIENYNDALNDNFIGWDIHHKDEIRLLPSGMTALRTREDLIENDRYYNCPVNELIWMRKAEHMALHAKYRRR